MDFGISLSSPRAPVPCDQCGKVFSNKANMNRHRISHSDVKTFECRLCHKQFHRKDQLQEHWMTHAKPNGDFDCPVLGCEEKFSCFNHLKNHTEQGHSITAITPVTCKHCFIPYKTTRRLMIHYHTRDLNLEHERLDKSEEPLDSANESMDVSQTSEGLHLVQQLFNSMPKLEPANRRKRKMQPVKIEPKEPETHELSNFLLNFIQQQCGLNQLSEEQVIPESVQSEVTASSNRSTPDSTISVTATESSKCDVSIDYDMNKEKTPEALESNAKDSATTIQTTPELIETEKYDCNICDISYKDRIMFFMHMGFHTKDQPLRCNMCGDVCSNAFDFNTHITYGQHSQREVDISKLT